MTDRDKIKAFVQDVLGCGCAEEVFRIIEIRREERAGQPYDRINIGNRLLVYVFRTDDAGWASRTLADLVRAGKTERDAEGFNRFRLVLAADAPAAMSPVMKAYGSLDLVDDRIFLHVIPKRQAAFRAREDSVS